MITLVRAHEQRLRNDPCSSVSVWRLVLALRVGVAVLATGAALLGCATAPESEPLPRYELPEGWEWKVMDGVTDHMTAIKYTAERPSGETDCDCPLPVEIIGISGTPPGSDEDARREIMNGYESGKSACESEMLHRPDVGDCGLSYQELTIVDHNVYAYFGEGLTGPVTIFAFSKGGKVVHGSVTGRADELLSELETVIGTLTWD